RLIELGEKARIVLHERITDRRIQNEVVLILGAIGDQRTVPLLIEAYPKVNVREPDWGDDFLKELNDPERLKVVCFTFALTSLTGQPMGRSRRGADCDPENRKRWQQWWQANKDTFVVPADKPNHTWVPAYPA